MSYSSIDNKQKNNRNAYSMISKTSSLPFNSSSSRNNNTMDDNIANNNHQNLSKESSSASVSASASLASYYHDYFEHTRAKRTSKQAAKVELETSLKSFENAQRLLKKYEKNHKNELNKENILEYKYYKSLLKKVEQMKKNEEKTKQQSQSITTNTPSNKNPMDITKNTNSWFVDFDSIQEEQCASMQKRKISQEYIEDEFYNYAPSYTEECIDLFQKFKNHGTNYNAIKRHRESSINAMPSSSSSSSSSSSHFDNNNDSSLFLTPKVKINKKKITNNARSSIKSINVLDSKKRIQWDDDVSVITTTTAGCSAYENSSVSSNASRKMKMKMKMNDSHYSINQNLDSAMLHNHVHTLLSYLATNTNKHNKNNMKYEVNECQNNKTLNNAKNNKNNNDAVIIDVSNSLKRVVNNNSNNIIKLHRYYQQKQLQQWQSQQPQKPQQLQQPRQPQVDNTLVAHNAKEIKDDDNDNDSGSKALYILSKHDKNESECEKNKTTLHALSSTTIATTAASAPSSDDNSFVNSINSNDSANGDNGHNDNDENHITAKHKLDKLLFLFSLKIHEMITFSYFKNKMKKKKKKYFSRRRHSTGRIFRRS